MASTRIVFCLLALTVSANAHWGDAPTAAEYDQVNNLMNMGILPWPHGTTTGPYVKRSPSDLASLGAQYFSQVPSSQNPTVMATVLYDWSQPDYVRFQFPLTTPNNLTAMEAQINSWPSVGYPHVPQMFNLSGYTPQQNDQQLAEIYPQVQAFSAAETAVLQYSLYTLPSVDYTAATAPQALYRGGGRETTYFCNQFGSQYGVSVDECMVNNFQPGSVLQVNPFWSTTPDESVVAHYRGLSQYTILPNPAVRSGWLPREIDQFSIQVSNKEWLYPHGSQFEVLNATCATSASTGETYWNVFLMELGPDTYQPGKISPPAGAPAVPSYCVGSQGSVFLSGSDWRSASFAAGNDSDSPGLPKLAIAAIVIVLSVVAVVTVLGVVGAVRSRRQRKARAELHQILLTNPTDE
eukprot:CAMPEP_0114559222 /NCGR_PEP_ID=MMETSP0114-20121206/10806_1 /TAXON_ID=31324 /ORGANISM="Goniomonas sp, Strain m" /LENGTH=407 /DNA_ID=CAMNT_0001744677 /DNA_START=18 /DNA_END=1241 /DNA_ORIENTATION=-